MLFLSYDMYRFLRGMNDENVKQGLDENGVRGIIFPMNREQAIRNRQERCTWKPFPHPPIMVYYYRKNLHVTHENLR